MRRSSTRSGRTRRTHILNDGATPARRCADWNPVVCGSRTTSPETVRFVQIANGGAERSPRRRDRGRRPATRWPAAPSAVRLILGPLLPRTGYKQAAVPLCSGSAYPTDSRSPTTVPCHVPAPISCIAADTSSGVSITIVIKQPAVMPRPVPSAEPGGTGRRRTSEGSVAPWAEDLARPRHVFRVMLVTPASPDP